MSIPDTPLPDLSGLAKSIGRAKPRIVEDRRQVLRELGDTSSALKAGPYKAAARKVEAAVVLLETCGEMRSVNPETLFELLYHLVVGAQNSLSTDAVPGLRPSAARGRPKPGPAGGLLKLEQEEEEEPGHDVRIGTVLKNLGVASATQIDEALAFAKTSGIRLGEALVRIGVATQKQIDKALKVQNQLRYGTPMNATARAPEPNLPPPAPVDRGGPLRMANEVLFGEVAVRLGLATQAQVDSALRLKNATGVRIGEALVNSGALTWEDVKKVAAWQDRLRRGGDAYTGGGQARRGWR